MEMSALYTERFTIFFIDTSVMIFCLGKFEPSIPKMIVPFRALRAAHTSRQTLESNKLLEFPAASDSMYLAGMYSALPASVHSKEWNKSLASVAECVPIVLLD